MVQRRFNVLPGFGLTIGYTLMYLGLIVLLPVLGLFLRLAGVGLEEFWRMATDERALAAYRLTFGASFNSPALFATILTIVLLAVALLAVIQYLDRRLTPWRTAA